MAECFEDLEQEVEVIVMRRPEGRHAYVMKIFLQRGVQDLYVKVEFLGDRVFARSFHYSDSEPIDE